MANVPITLTTDFGIGSPYVAEMKGAILSVAPDCQLIDTTHCIAPQNVIEGAMVLRQIQDSFPDGSVHIAVVDPGVGTDRRILLVEHRTHFFIAPDNGLLTFQLDDATNVRVCDRTDFWREQVSVTFHGRDIMGPVAAHLANGRLPKELASPFTSQPIRLAIPSPQKTVEAIEGEVVYVDSFGNLITNISRSHLAERSTGNGPCVVEIAGQTLAVRDTYAEIPDGQLLALVGSNGWLEVAVNRGNAADYLQCGTSTPVRLRNKS